MKKLPMFLLLYWGCRCCLAADVTVQIHGLIVDNHQSCKIVTEDKKQVIIFDDLYAQNFPTKGTTSLKKLVTVNLENCTGEVDNLHYQFSGIADPTDSTLLKVIGSGKATDTIAGGLAIEILDGNASDTRVPLNKKQALNRTITDTNYPFRFYLRYIATQTPITVGNASSLLYLDMYYE